MYLYKESKNVKDQFSFRKLTLALRSSINTLAFHVGIQDVLRNMTFSLRSVRNTARAFILNEYTVQEKSAR